MKKDSYIASLVRGNIGFLLGPKVNLGIVGSKNANLARAGSRRNG